MLVIRVQPCPACLHRAHASMCVCVCASHGACAGLRTRAHLPDCWQRFLCWSAHQTRGRALVHEHALGTQGLTTTLRHASQNSSALSVLPACCRSIAFLEKERCSLFIRGSSTNVFRCIFRIVDCMLFVPTRYWSAKDMRRRIDSSDLVCVSMLRERQARAEPRSLGSKYGRKARKGYHEAVFSRADTEVCHTQVLPRSKANSKCFGKEQKRREWRTYASVPT
jgi:hypothetical protein